MLQLLRQNTDLTEMVKDLTQRIETLHHRVAQDDVFAPHRRVTTQSI